MNEDNDEILIQEIIDNNSSDALVELSERHTGIYFETIRKFLPVKKEPSYLDEYKDKKIGIVYDAVCSFKPEKGVKFVTWLANYTKYNCLSEKTKNAKSPDFYEFTDSMGGSTDLNPSCYLELKEETKEILQKVKKKFGERVYGIFYDKYFGGEHNTDQTLTEVAEKYGVSPQAIQVTHQKVLDYLQKHERIKNSI